MLINFFHGLRDAGVPVTTRELLDLLEGLKQHIAFADMDEFYFFSRACMSCWWLRRNKTVLLVAEEE